MHMICGFIFVSSIWLLSSGRLITLWEFRLRIRSWGFLAELLETVSIIEGGILHLKSSLYVGTFHPTFNYPVERCKITVILFGSMLPNL